MADGDGIVARAWRTAADFGAIAGLVSDAWNGPRRPLVSITIGDLEWWTALGGANVDWSRRIRLWERHGALAAWGWFKPPIELDWFIAAAGAPPPRDRARDDPVART